MTALQQQFTTTESPIRETSVVPRPIRRTVDELIEAHLHLLPIIANRVSRHVFAGQVDPEDLAQDGYVGLARAAERFDPAKRIKFSTYAGIRIRGAMIDAHRIRESMPRRAIQRDSDLATVERDFVRRVGREADLADDADRAALAQALECSDADLARHIEERKLVERWELTSLEAPVETSRNKTMPLSETLGQHRERAPEQELDQDDEIDRLTRGLTAQQRTALLRYVVDELTMKEIAGSMGLSESRISQILSEVRAILAVRLEGRAA